MPNMLTGQGTHPRRYGLLSTGAGWYALDRLTSAPITGPCSYADALLAASDHETDWAEIRCRYIAAEWSA